MVQLDLAVPRSLSIHRSRPSRCEWAVRTNDRQYGILGCCIQRYAFGDYACKTNLLWYSSCGIHALRHVSTDALPQTAQLPPWQTDVEPPFRPISTTTTFPSFQFVHRMFSGHLEHSRRLSRLSSQGSLQCLPSLQTCFAKSLP